MHHQYRPYNLERLYGAQHYTYGYKVQLLPRTLGGFMEVMEVSGCTVSLFSAHFSMVLPIACQVFIPFGVYGQPHVLTLGQFIYLSVY